MSAPPSIWSCIARPNVLDDPPFSVGQNMDEFRHHLDARLLVALHLLDDAKTVFHAQQGWERDTYV